MPLPGVSVVIEGTQFGTTTDLDGKYSIRVTEGQTVVFSFVGMKDVKYRVGAASTYNPTMYSDSAILEGVIVLAYGQSKTVNDITGNVVQVKGDVIASTPVSTVDQALTGRVAGLNMSSTTGSPGAMQQVRIRGRNSLSATNEPLYVVDGMPITNDNVSGSTSATSLSPLSSINADDIETMTVLKDAAATSAYGARGSNGVILITTKKGTRGDAKYTLRTSLGFQDLARKGPKFLNGAQKEELWLEAIYNSNGEKYGFSKDQTLDWYQNSYGGAYKPGVLNNWINAGRKNNDWLDAVRQKGAVMSSLNLSATGGDDKGYFYASLGHDKFKGTTIGVDYRKVAANFTFTRNLSDKVEITIGANVSNILQNAILEGGAYFSNPNLTAMFANPWQPIYNADGSYNLNTSMPNTLYITKHNDYKNDLTRVISNNSLKYKIIDNLNFVTNIGLDYMLSNYQTYYNPVHGDGAAYKGYASQTDRKAFNYVWQNSLDYRFYIKDLHRFDVKALMEFQKNKVNWLQGTGQVLPPGMKSLGVAAANYEAWSDFTDWAQLGFLGMVNYSYDNRYLLDLTIREEGSSRFSEDHRWGTFYAIGGAWNISEEAFMQDVDFLDLFRFRTSWGTTGNSSIDVNQYQQLLVAGSYNNESALYANQIGGPLGWEKQQKFDIGLEFAMFDNRLSGSFAWFHSKTTDLLYKQPLSMTSGFENFLTNIGDLSNEGFEVELNYDLIRSEEFNISIGGNIGTVKNRMTRMPIIDGKPLETISSYNIVKEGHAIQEWFMREYAGVNPDNGNAMWYMADGTKTENYNLAERRFQGTSALPKFSGGVTANIDYRGFYVNALFSFAGGYSIYDAWAGYTNTVNAQSLFTYNGVTELLDRWQEPGDITDVPRVSEGGNTFYSSVSDRFLYKGDHIRLKQLSLGYNFNKRIANKLGVDGINLSVTGHNLVTWVKEGRLKADPEVSDSGYIEMGSPVNKSVIFSLNINF